MVVGADEIAAVVHVLAGDVEQRLLISARHRQVVVRDEPGGEQVVEVVVHRRPRREQLPPAPRCQTAATGGAHRRIAGGARWRRAIGALPISGLQQRAIGGVVDEQLAAEGRPRGTRLPALRGDEHHALPSPRPVDGSRRGALQDLDRGNVGGIDVGAAVRCNGTGHVVPRPAGDGRRVVDWYTVHYDQRLAGAVNRVATANADERRRPGVAGSRDHLDVRSLACQGLDEVHLVAPLDQRRVHMVSYAAQLLGLGSGTGSRHDHLAELQWVRGEGEVMCQSAWGERDLRAQRPVTKAPRLDADRLSRNANSGDDEGVTAVIPGERAQAEARNRDLDLRERLTGVARHRSSDGDRLLRGQQGRQREERAENDGYELTACDSHVPSDAVCVDMQWLVPPDVAARGFSLLHDSANGLCPPSCCRASRWSPCPPSGNASPSSSR